MSKIEDEKELEELKHRNIMTQLDFQRETNIILLDRDYAHRRRELHKETYREEPEDYTPRRYREEPRAKEPELPDLPEKSMSKYGKRREDQ